MSIFFCHFLYIFDPFLDICGLLLVPFLVHFRLNPEYLFLFTDQTNYIMNLVTDGDPYIQRVTINNKAQAPEVIIASDAIINMAKHACSTEAQYPVALIIGKPSFQKSY